MVETKTIYWLSGILEGEGSFLCTTTYGCAIRMGSTDEDVVRRAAQVMDAKIYGPYTVGKYKPVWHVFLAGTRAAGWMMTLYSLMGKRRKEQIDKALESWKNHRNSHSLSLLLTPEQRMEIRIKTGKENAMKTQAIWLSRGKMKNQWGEFPLKFKL